MLQKKKLKLVALSILALAFTACGNNGIKLSAAKPNATSNANRIITSNTSGTGGANGSFSSAVALTYYAGVTGGGNALQGVTVARGTSNQNQIRVSAPNIGSGSSICVITAVEYVSNTCDNSGTFFRDVGEERCGNLVNGSVVIDLARSDFNIVTVVQQSNLQQFINWYNGTIESDAYPTLAEGQISPDLPQPACF
jgi:hypothetical protein